MGINILSREVMGMFLYTYMGMAREYGHGNGQEWDRKSHSRTSLLNSPHFLMHLNQTVKK